jgi:hypothetical protein
MSNPIADFFNRGKKIHLNGSAHNLNPTASDDFIAPEEPVANAPVLTTDTPMKKPSAVEEARKEYTAFKGQNFYAIGNGAGLRATSLNDKNQLISQYEGRFKTLTNHLVLALQQENVDLENKKTKAEPASFDIGNIDTQVKKNNMEIEKLSKDIAKDFRVDPTADLYSIFTELSRGYDYGRSNF